MGITLDFEPSLAGINLKLLLISEENRGKGYGTEIMKNLCRAADLYKTNIELRAESESLKAWYERFGFITMDGEYMIRVYRKC